MNFKTLILLSIFPLLASYTMAQNNAGKADDAERIAISSFVGEDQGLTPSAKKLLETKLEQVITRNGLAAEKGNALFLMKAEVNELSKEISPTSPPMHAYTLEIVLSVTDRITGNIAHSTSIEVKGVGSNESKAYIQAIKQINPASPQLRKFVETAKEKTLEFYNSKCDDILKYANTLIAQGKNNDAIALLNSVPGISKDCYMKCMDLAATIEPQEEDSEVNTTDITPSPVNSGVAEEESTEQTNPDWIIEVEDGVFLTYLKNKTIGQKLIVELQFDNTNEKDIPVFINKYKIRIFDEQGNVIPCLRQEFTNISRTNISSKILPDVPMKLTLEFSTPPSVKLLEIEIFNNTFKYYDIPLQ